MCTVLLPPGDNSIAVNKYININIILCECEVLASLRQVYVYLCSFFLDPEDMNTLSLEL